jgi:DNA repair exonuclease SbcCD ATPase subunit
MQIVEHRVENVCQHPRRTFQFHPGMNGILGSNGVGKSNLLKSIQFSFTGSFPNDGVKAENIRQGREASEPSRVITLWTHGNVSYRTERHLTKVDATLHRGDELLARGETNVNREILSILAVREDVLQRQCFVPQGEIAAFLAESPAVRAATYARIFGTERASELYAFLDRMVRSNPIPAVNPNIELYRKEVAGFQREIRNKSRTRGLIASEAGDEQTLAAIERVQNALTVIARETERRDRQLIPQVEPLKAKIQQRSEELEALNGSLAAIQASIEDAARQEANNAAWDAYERGVRSANEAEQRIEAAKHALEAIREPESPEPGVTSQEISDQISTVYARLQSLEVDLGAYAVVPSGTCPVCRRPGADLDQTILDLTAEVERHRTELSSLRGRLGSFIAFDRAIGDVRRQRQAIEAEIRSQTDRIEAIRVSGAQPPATPRAHVDASEARRARLEAQTLTNAIREDRFRSSELLDAVEGQIADCDRQIASSLDVLGREPVEFQSFDAARLQTMRELQGTLKTIDGELQVLNRFLEQRERELKLLNEQEATLKPRRAWLDVVTNTRDAFHPTALPRQVAERNQAVLIDVVNEILTSYGVDWRVTQGQDLSFVACFDDGRIQRDRRLSPGQSTALALAIRVAIHSLFTSELGFLSLDEPTYGLSQRNLGFVAKALSRLRLLTDGGSLQCLVVTHEPLLLPEFDRVIDLDHAVES